MPDRSNSSVNRRVPPSTYLFLLGAETRSALGENVAALRAKQAQAKDVDLTALMLANGRSVAGPHRLALLATSIVELGEKLAQATLLLQGTEETHRQKSGILLSSEPRRGKIAWLFPGQGSQFAGMLSELAVHLPVVQRWFDALDKAYKEAGKPLPSIVLRDEASSELFDMQTGAQLGLAASMAMADLLRALGVQPDCMVGHSNGEHAALLAAGAFGNMQPEDACVELAAVSSLAGKLSAPTKPEGMLAVGIIKRAILDRILAERREDLFLAIDNSPTQILLGGTTDALEKAAIDLKPPVAICTRLPLQRAHHTPLFADWAETLKKHFEAQQTGPGNVPVYSAAKTHIFPPNPATIREWMAQQWCTTVRFRETIERMYADDVRIFIEVGPEAKLTALVQDILRNKPRLALSASSASRGEWMQLLQLCAELHAAGLNLNMDVLDGCYAEPIPSPANAAYRRPENSSFVALVRAEHQRTADAIAAAEKRLRKRLQEISPLRIAEPPCDAYEPISGQMVRRSASGAVFRVRLSSESSNPYLRDHAMGTTAWGGKPLEVVSFTYTLALAADAAERFMGRACKALKRVRAHRWLALDCGALEVEIQVTDNAVRLFALQDGTAHLAFEAEFSLLNEHLFAPSEHPACGFVKTQWSPERFYRDYAFHGPTYRCLQSVRIAGEAVEAALESTHPPGAGCPLDPALMDCAGQLVAFWLLENGSTEPGVFPFAMESVELRSAVPAPGTRLICRGRVTRSRFGTTSSSFDFLLPNGDVLWRMTKLEQKIVDFPQGTAGALFGKDETPFIAKTISTGSSAMVCWLDQERIKFLESGQGLWSRVLAHGMLDAAGLEQLYAATPNMRSLQLMREIVTREVAQHWKMTRGGPPPIIESLQLDDLLIAAATDVPARLFENFVEPAATQRILWQKALQGHSIIMERDAG